MNIEFALRLKESRKLKCDHPLSHDQVGIVLRNDYLLSKLKRLKTRTASREEWQNISILEIMNQLKKETNTDSELFSKNQDISVALSLPNQRPNHLTEMYALSTFLLNSNIIKSKCNEKAPACAGSGSSPDEIMSCIDNITL